MKDFFQKMRYVLSRENENLRERMFCIINLVAAALAICGMIETFPLADGKLVMIALCIFLFSLLFSIFITIQYHMLNLGSGIVGIALCCLVFPGMFFLSGGIEGGATVYFSLNIIYTCIMFEGAGMYAFLALDVISDLITYAVAFYHPEYVVALDGRQAVFLDSMYSVIAVGISVGIMVKLHIGAYSRQSKKVQEQKEELQKNSATKNNFFASMSHEIRTPINTIIGLNEMILRENREGSTREYAESVKNAGKMLLNLVNDILDLSQMEMGRIEIVPVQYRTEEFINDLVTMMQVQMEAKNLQFIQDIDAELPSVLLGDKKRLEQVMINLLTNAVKYTPEGSVTLTIKEEERTDESIKLRISVQDTGVGIRKEDMSNLYDIFKRLDQVKNQKVEGSGLGLAITKQLVDLMGGELSVDSIYTKGSTFTVLLTQQIEDATSMGSWGESLLAKAGGSEEYRQLFEAPEARILVVDDTQMNLVVVSKLLQATRVQIDLARSGEECLEKTRNKYYHVILLDHMMAGMDGIETVAEIRKQDNGLCRDTAVIAMTANVKSNADVFYREQGFDAYLEKPIDSAMLEKYLLSYLPSEIIEYRRQDQEMENKMAIRTIHSRRKKKIMITTDCVAEFSQSVLEQYHIGVMYLYIKTDKGRFADTREIDSDNLAQYITDEETLAYADRASVEEYEQFYADQLTQAEDIIHISMASGSGESYFVAVTAAQSFSHVHVIDSKQISCGQSLLVLWAAQLAAKENLSVEEMIRQIENKREMIETQFLMPSIRVFAQNGYASAGQGRFYGRMKLHPILKMRNGKITPIGFYGGDIDNARKHFVRRYLKKKRKIQKDVVYISHVALSVKKQEMIKDEIMRYVEFEEVYNQKASFSCACNSGLGTFGFAYYVNK